jgi:hypothetical protein
MRPFVVALCFVMAVLCLRGYLRLRAPSRLLKLLFWAVLLASSFTRFLPLLLLAGLLLVLIVLRRQFPFHAIALESRVAMWRSKGEVRNCNEMLAEMPGLVEAKNEDLHEKLNDANPDIRMLAIDILAERKDRTAVPRLLALLEDGEANDRVTIMNALGKIGDPAVVSGVSKFLGHDDGYVREKALTCLRALRNPEALPAIAEQLQKETRPELIRMSVQTLYDLGTEDAVKAHWNALGPQVKIEYLSSIHYLAEERPKEISFFAVYAAQDPSEEVRQESQTLTRRMLLHEYKKQYADIFPAKDMVKSAMNEPRSLTLRTDRLLRFDAGDGGYLEVRPGEFTADLSARYEREATCWEETDVAEVSLRLADDRADIWEAVFPVQASTLFEAVLTVSGKRYYGDVSEDIRRAFDERMLLRGLQTMDDSRNLRRVRIDKDLVEVLLKYQSPVMDVALHEGSGDRPACLLIRVFHVTGWHSGELPPFVSAFPLMAFVFRMIEKKRGPANRRDGEVRVRKVGQGRKRQPTITYSPK